MQSVYKIGVILPLTGSLQQYGQWLKNGLILAQDEINQDAKAKIKLELICQDDEGQPAKAAQVMEQLARDKDIALIFGSWSSACVLAQAPLAEQYKIVTLAVAMTPRASQLSSFIFNIQPPASTYIKKLAVYSYHELDYSRASIIFLDDEFGQSQSTVFSDVFTKEGGRILSQYKIKRGEAEFVSIINDIQSRGSEVIFAPLYLEIIDLLKQAEDLNFSAQFIASAPFENRIILEKAGQTAEGVIYPYHYPVQPVNEKDVVFRQKYKEKYGQQPEGFAALAYDGLKFIAQALTLFHLLSSLKGEDLSREAIRKNFYEIYFYGVTGETVFQDNNTVMKPIFIKTVQDGSFADYEEVIVEEFMDDLRLCPTDL